MKWIDLSEEKLQRRGFVASRERATAADIVIDAIGGENPERTSRHARDGGKSGLRLGYSEGRKATIDVNNLKSGKRASMKSFSQFASAAGQAYAEGMDTIIPLLRIRPAVQTDRVKDLPAG